MASERYAFVTLVTSDYYLPGALAQVAALREVHIGSQIQFETVCIVTPETLDVSTIKILRRSFDVVVGVEVLGPEPGESRNLVLLGRPDLNTVLTKLHIFRMTEYSKIIFLDADVLPLRPLSHLFQLSNDFSACPDVGWPDCFNSGVLVFSPGAGQFEELRELSKKEGSWDGGDQGILNEWRASDWNRLSFIYNTTPTGAYTYAPAYARFGSQIAAVHFIGANKPWSAIPYRAPGSAAATPKTVPSVDAFQAYDMGSLVDRWFSVYDRNYRSHALADPEFEVKKYAAVWEGKDTSALLNGSLGLDELKSLALHGLSSSVIGAQPSNGVEGEYRSMSIEGRIDLMRPKKVVISPSIIRHIDLPTGEIIRMDTLPTPGPNEMPPAPQLRGHSLPLVSPPIMQYWEEPLRPSSPPKLEWNPSIEPPPTHTPSASVFPTKTYFHNAWDNHRSHFSEPTPDSSALFEAPPRTEIPQSLLLQGHYRRVTGDHSPGQGPSPDSSKVQNVFPWESQPRQTPGRVFPASEPGLAFNGWSTPGSQQVEQAHSPPTFENTRSSLDARGLPTSLNYANAWDTVPSIQKYASRLVRPPPSAMSLPPLDTTIRYGWEEKQEASSRDGDDEDEATSSVDDDSEDERGTPRRHRSRKSSISSTHVIQGNHKEYVVRGVQTMVKETRNAGVQVDTTPSLQSKKPVRSHQPHSTTPTQSKRPTLSQQSTMTDIPAGMRSPRDYDLANISSPAEPALPLPRLVSSESQPSPPSTVGPLSPPDSILVGGSPQSATSSLPLRQAARVFDPARGVDVFKQGSQEVLARFIRMGSFDDKASA